MATQRDIAMTPDKATTSLTQKALPADRSTSDASDAVDSSQYDFNSAEEARLRRKIDWHVVPSVFIIYLFCFIDRANIGNAKIAHLDADLHLMGFDYNAILSVFFISYILFEIPSNIACKLAGPRIWLPTLTLGFGICTITLAFVNNRAQIMGVRFLLGVFEAGMLPGVAYYLSRWYRRNELSFRLGLYIVASPLAGATGGLLASAIFTLDNIGTVRGWRMLFLVEGIITAGLASIAFFTISDSPASATWLSPAEKALAQQRVLSERIGSTAVLEKLNVRKVLRGMMNPVVVLTGLIFLFDNVTVAGLAFFLPTIISIIYPQATVIEKQLYTVPPYLSGAVFTVLIPYLSARFRTRIPIMIASAPFMMFGYILFLASTNPQVRYAATFFITAGAFAFGALCPAHAAANVDSDSARASAIGLVVMMGSCGALISTWSFLPWDAPNYFIGNGLNFATSAGILVTSVVMLFWMRYDNRRRDRVEEADLAKLRDLEKVSVDALEWRHPQWRWRI